VQYFALSISTTFYPAMPEAAGMIANIKLESTWLCS